MTLSITTLSIMTLSMMTLIIMTLGRGDTQHNNTQHNDTDHNDTQHNDTQYVNKTCNAQHNEISGSKKYVLLSGVRLSVIILGDVLLSVAGSST